MPVHDWSRVSDGTFHDFHYSWVLEIKRALKRGLLPEGYDVVAEQLGGDVGAPDVLTLQANGGPIRSPDALSGTATVTHFTACQPSSYDNSTRSLRAATANFGHPP